MKVIVDASWDPDAHVWVGEARGDVGLVTEAATVEELERRVGLVLPDLLGSDSKEPLVVELVAKRTWVIAAE